MSPLSRKKLVATGDGKGYVRIFSLGDALTSIVSGEAEALEDLVSTEADWLITQ